MSSQAKRRRQQPYDMENPANWTVNKLKTELENRGLKLTTTVSKAALLQIYQQVSKTDNDSVNNRGAQISQDKQTEASRDQVQPNTRSAAANQNITPATSGVATSVTETLQAANTGHISSLGMDSGAAMGMFTAMQSTISSLQATVSQLLTERTTSSGQSSQPSTNLLQKYYGMEPAQTTATTTTTITAATSKFGVPADSLPHVDVITDSVKKNILEGKYVNLACLMIPDFETPNFTTNNTNGLELLKQGRKDHRLDRALTITQFFRAFGVYKRIMSEAYPQRRLELDLYEADIGNIYEHYGDIFYQYHCQFTKKAAAYLEKGIKVDWSKRDKDLFQLIVGGAKTKLCEHCFQCDHQSPFCPSQYNVQSALTNYRRQNDITLGKYSETRTDKKGRSRVTFQGREICNNFNNDSCKYNPGKYPFAHVCKKCKSEDHGESRCNTLKESTTAQTVLSHEHKEKKQKPIA